MNKPSERIVVFVSPAQKRAITATAEELGISISELMRRAVLNFGATSEQVKAASIVDRLRAPREPDALNEALLRVARATKRHREALPAALASADASVQCAHEATVEPGRDSSARDATSVTQAPVAALQALSNAVTADALPEHAQAADAQAAADAAARVATAKAAALKAKAKSMADAAARDDSPFIDPTEGTGRFA
ncbi:plasmid mobilization protein [Paraburkholderia rhizosphaerae]|nr:hypothetical protein [Paraburkholderia rhizosphaerae]